MIKFFKNNYHLRKSLYILAIVIIAIIFYRYTENMTISNFIPVILGVLSPFIIGSILAYLLNTIMVFIEKQLRKFALFKTNTKAARITAITLSLIAVIGVISCIISYIIPEIILNAQNVINFLVRFDAATVRDYTDKFLTSHNINLSVSTYRSLLRALDEFLNSVTDLLKYLPDMLISVLTHAIEFASSAVNIIIGIMVAVYLLLDKEKALNLSKKTLYLFFNDHQVKAIVSTIKSTNAVFNRFFVGKTIDSLIIGLLFLIGAMILDLPYSMLFALIIGITNMIPYFGPFIGAVPVVALTLLVNPIKGLWVLIFIIILQQFDGIILGPRILGDSIGLKPIGVIFAIIVGGAIAGPLGMFFGVPIFSVIVNALIALIDKVYMRKSSDAALLVTADKENEDENTETGE